MRSMSLREKADYDHRLDLLLDEMASLRENLAVCSELLEEAPAATVASEYAAEIAIRSATELSARLIRIQQYLDACAIHRSNPTLWELGLLMRDQTPTHLAIDNQEPKP